MGKERREKFATGNVAVSFAEELEEVRLCGEPHEQAAQPRSQRPTGGLRLSQIVKLAAGECQGRGPQGRECRGSGSASSALLAWQDDTTDTQGQPSTDKAASDSMENTESERSKLPSSQVHRVQVIRNLPLVTPESDSEEDIGSKSSVSMAASTASSASQPLVPLEPVEQRRAARRFGRSKIPGFVMPSAGGYQF